MPKIFTIKKKKVEKKDRRAEVLNLYFESVKDLDPKQRESLRISDQDIHLTDFFSQFKQKFDIGGVEYFLDGLEASIGEYSCQMLEEYISEFLNPLIQHAETSPESATDKENIGSRYVLVYEILLRFAVVLLSEEENKKRDVNKLLKAMNNFGKSLTSNTTLELNTQFKHFLYENHGQWVACLTDSVNILQALNSPTRTFTAACNYFAEAERYAKAQIIALLRNDLEKGKLDPKWINKTYEESLKRIAGPTIHIFSIQTKSVKPKQVCLSENQNAVIMQLQKEAVDRHKVDKIGALFIFLNRTMYSKILFTAIDSLISIGNWMFLLKNPLNIQVLAQHIKMHSEECRKIFSFSDLKAFADSKNIGVLMSVDMGSGDDLASKTLNIHRDLMALTVSEVHHVVKHVAMGSLERILECEHMLGVNVINYEQLKLMSSVTSSVVKKESFLPREDKIQFIDNTEVSDNLSHEREKNMQPRAQQRISNTEKKTKLAKVDSQSAPGSRGYRAPAEMPNSSTVPQKNDGSIRASMSATPKEKRAGISKVSTEKRSHSVSSDAPDPMANESAPPTISEVPQIRDEKNEDLKKVNKPKKSIKNSSDDEDIALNTSTKTEYKGTFFKNEPPQTFPINEAPSSQSSKLVVDIVYVKNFFNSFLKRERDVFFGLYEKYIDLQKKMGQVDRPPNMKIPLEDFSLESDDFLNTFYKKNFFSFNVSSFCRLARNIILTFERTEMEYEQPFISEGLWKQRHLELFCLKYLCVNAVKRNDDTLLALFISDLTNFAEESLIYSRYDALKKNLRDLNKERAQSEQNAQPIYNTDVDEELLTQKEEFREKASKVKDLEQKIEKDKAERDKQFAALSNRVDSISPITISCTIL